MTANEMATRFADCIDELIQSFEETTLNKNIATSTKDWLRAFKSWAKQAGHGTAFKVWLLRHVL